GLVDKLRDLELLPVVDDAMQAFRRALVEALEWDARADALEMIDYLTCWPMRVTFDSSRGKVLQSLCERLLADKLPEPLRDRQHFMASLRLFLTMPDEFSIDRLREEMYQLLPMSSRQISEFFGLFNSRGLLHYNRERRTYSFHWLIKHLDTVAYRLTDTR